MRLEQLSFAEWEEALPETGFEVFHTPEGLSALAAHTDADLRLYGGFKGDQPVGLFPAFVRDGLLGRAVVSPPPGYAVAQLGPLVMPTSPKQRKREKVNRAFAEALLAELAVADRLTVFRAVCPTAYPDPRPYVWSDLGLSTAFTYRLAIDEDTEGLLRSFSQSLRREIRGGRSLDVTVSVEGVDACRAVFEQTRDRYGEQDRGFTLRWPYVKDVYERLAEEGRARTYVARDPAGALLSGITALYSNDAGYYWLGGARTTYEGTSINSLLHWAVIEDIATDPPRETVAAYDLVGANTERLCRYKSKFGAALVPHYVVESNGAATGLAKAAYRLLRR